jgi:hypothetical protein
MMPIAVHASDQFVTKERKKKKRAQTLLDTSTNFVEPHLPLEAKS